MSCNEKSVLCEILENQINWGLIETQMNLTLSGISESHILHSYKFKWQ